MTRPRRAVTVRTEDDRRGDEGSERVPRQHAQLHPDVEAHQHHHQEVRAQGLDDAVDRDGQPGPWGLHSSTFRLNVSAFCGTGGTFRGCLGGVKGVFRRSQGYLGVFKVYSVSETAQVELKSGRVLSPCRGPVRNQWMGTTARMRTQMYLAPSACTRCIACSRTSTCTGSIGVPAGRVDEVTRGSRRMINNYDNTSDDANYDKVRQSVTSKALQSKAWTNHRLGSTR